MNEQKPEYFKEITFKKKPGKKKIISKMTLDEIIQWIVENEMVHIKFNAYENKPFTYAYYYKAREKMKKNGIKIKRVYAPTRFIKLWEKKIRKLELKKLEIQSEINQYKKMIEEGHEKNNK